MTAQTVFSAAVHRYRCVICVKRVGLLSSVRSLNIRQIEITSLANSWYAQYINSGERIHRQVVSILYVSTYVEVMTLVST